MQGEAERALRWLTLARLPLEILLVVVHTWVNTGLDSSAVRIISARRPARNEARQYREEPTP
jgi:uncharacterized protein